MEEYFPAFESILSVDEVDVESVALVRFSSLAFQMISHWVQNVSFTRRGIRVSCAISLFSCPRTSAGPMLMHPGEFYLLSFPHALTQDFCLMRILKPRGFVEMPSIVQHGEISVHLHLESYSSPPPGRDRCLAWLGMRRGGAGGSLSVMLTQPSHFSGTFPPLPREYLKCLGVSRSSIILPSDFSSLYTPDSPVKSVSALLCCSQCFPGVLGEACAKDLAGSCRFSLSLPPWDSKLSYQPIISL